MFNARRGSWIPLLAGAILVAAAGAGGIFAQEAEAPGLDVDALAERLSLDEEGRADLASLENLLQRRAAMHEGMMRLRSEMRSTMQGLRQRLDAEQRQELTRSLRDSGLMHMGPAGRGGMDMGRRGAHMRGGRQMGGGMTAPDARGQRLRMHEPGTNPDCPYGTPDAGAPSEPDGEGGR